MSQWLLHTINFAQRWGCFFSDNHPFATCQHSFSLLQLKIFLTVLLAVVHLGLGSTRCFSHRNYTQSILISPYCRTFFLIFSFISSTPLLFVQSVVIANSFFPESWRFVRRCKKGVKTSRNWDLNWILEVSCIAWSKSWPSWGSPT